MFKFDQTLLEAYGRSEPILPGDIASLFPDLTRARIYQMIEESIDRGFLERYRRGVYYIPEDGIFGKTSPSAAAVVERKYITDGEETYGYYSGLTLENKAGVSPQVPAVLEITTNKASKRVREIEPFGGWRAIKLRKPRTEIDAGNVEALMLLDLITSLSPSSLNGHELANLKDLARSVGREKAAFYSRYYPAKTSKRLIESEAIGVFA